MTFMCVDVMDKIIADAKTPADLKDRCQKIRAQVRHSIKSPICLLYPDRCCIAYRLIATARLSWTSCSRSSRCATAWIESPRWSAMECVVQVTSPGTGNELSAAVEFNMMFPTSIGPTGLVKGCA